MNELEPITFGQVLRRFRIARGWTQQELAERAGISVEAVATLERGTRRTPRRDTLDRLAAALELDAGNQAEFLTAGHLRANGNGSHSREVERRVRRGSNTARRQPWFRQPALFGTLTVVLAALIVASTVFGMNTRGARPLHLKLLAVRTDPAVNPVHLQAPSAVALDPQDNLYFADRSLDIVARVSSTGQLLQVYGHAGTAPGQFRNPEGLAVDRHGDIFVADTENGRIQILAPDGHFLRELGGAGKRIPHLVRPVSVAVDGLGRNVYIADAGSRRIIHLTREGRVVWERPVAARAVAVDRYGTVYVLDRRPHANSRQIAIERYTADGALVRELNPYFTERELWPDPRTLTTDNFGSLLVGMGSNGIDVNTGYTVTVVPFSSTMRSVDGLAVNRDQHIYVADAADHQIVLMSMAGEVLRRFREFAFGARQPWIPTGIAVGAHGSLYVGDRAGRTLDELDSSGRLVQSWFGTSNGTGVLNTPEDIVRTSSGGVYVSDPDSGIVFDAIGAYLFQWRSTQPYAPRSMVADPTGHIYVSIGGFIQKFLDNGLYVSAVPESYVRGLATDAAGVLYVARGTRPVDRYAPDDRPLPALHLQGLRVDALAIGSDGRLYVLDRTKRELMVLNAGGRVLAAVTGPGSGRFGRPHDVAVDPSGHVYVSDTGTHRVDIFGIE